MQKIKQLEGITNAIEAGSRVMSQASASQQRAAECEAKENLLGRQATLINDQRKIMISMHKEQQGAIVCIPRLERQYSGDPQDNKDMQEETRTRHMNAESQVERRRLGVSPGRNRPCAPHKYMNQPRHSRRGSKALPRGRSTSQSGTAPATSTRKIGEPGEGRARPEATWDKMRQDYPIGRLNGLLDTFELEI